MKRRDFLRSAMLASAAAAYGCASRREDHESPPREPRLSRGEFPEAAVRYFVEEKKSCAESLVLAGCRMLGAEEDLLPAAALGLGGGIGLRGKPCACLTGGAMVLSLAAFMKEKDYAARKKLLYKVVGGFVERFEKELGATDCRALCGLDLTTREGMTLFQEKKKAEVCGPIMRKAALLVVEAMKDIAPA